MKKKFNLRNISLLRITLLTGCILLLLIGGILGGIFIDGGGAARGFKENAFYRLLREYDFKYGQIPEAGSDAVRRQAFERLDNDLDRLEKRAGGVESWLSVLKRRRQLAQFDPYYEQAYRQSSRRAAAAFPYSEPVAAVAAAALVHNSAITREGNEYLRIVLPLLASSRLNPMRLSLHVLLGDFKNPETAAASLPAHFAAPEPAAETIIADLIIIKILNGEIPSAAVDIQSALSAAALNAEPSPGLSRLAAEYFYDFGDLLRSAELFSTLPDEEALSRQADALWLAGYTDNARTIWTMQIMPNEADPFGGPANRSSGDAVYNRALYNLALTAPTLEEEAALLERLVIQGAGDESRRFGLIHFSRLFDAPQALAILDAEKGPADFLIELETLKRRTEIGELARMFAETWLLLDRYPETEDMYQWGAWYFNLQRNFTESGKLLQIAARHNFSGYWVSLYGALQCIRNGDLDTAGEMLAAASALNDDWAAAANRGRVLESSHAPSRALEQYERAMALLTAPEAPAEDWQNIASRIQVRIALCLRSMGRDTECRRALDYALDLNPDNLTARLELNRL